MEEEEELGSISYTQYNALHFSPLNWNAATVFCFSRGGNVRVGPFKFHDIVSFHKTKV
jgi:hypothetical protein